jgi:hypothetical protein
VGAVDSIADILCAAVGFDYFGVEQFFCTAVKVGHGTVKCDHGILPVPPPATALLLTEFETFAGPLESEMTTPTGAAILAALAKPLPPMLPVRRKAIGYGAGDREFKQTPNALRIFLGEEASREGGAQEVVEIQTNIDDMNPQLYGPLFETLLDQGALDVFYQPVVMKQGRPGVLLTVLCEETRRDALSQILFRETTTLGLRYLYKRREVLDRSFVAVETLFGTIRIKIGQSSSGVLNYAAEFDECRRAAGSAGVAIKEVYNAAMAAYRERHSTSNPASKSGRL